MSLNVRENVSLAPLTTLKIGGPARFFITAERDEDVAAAFEYADSNDLEVFVLGGGSNVLVADGGFDGLVLQIALKGIDIKRVPEERSPTDARETAIVIAAAGEDWDPIVAACVSKGLAGLECLSGIPGLVGATPIQNVGAYGREVSDAIVSVHCFDRITSEFVVLSNEDCVFSYRGSIFNSSLRDRYVVISVCFELTANGEPKIGYRDLMEYFGNAKPTLEEVRAAVLKIRRSKSMVIDREDPNSRSAGSFFKNPIITAGSFRKVLDRFENVPHFAATDGMVKIPAAWLIEKAGFSKGYSKGEAGISSNHTLAIVNRGHASATEIAALKNEIQTAVNELFDIKLEPEPIFIGF